MLRGAAAVSVAFLHIEQAAGAFVGRPGQSPWPWLRALPWEAGVDVFFVISGFVMAYSSAVMFGRPGAVRSFLARRVARVVPLYWLFTTATLAVAFAAPRLLNDPISGGWPAVVASYLFVPWPRQDGAMQPLFRLGWTLNYEMLFYALFAPFLLMTRRAGSAGVIAVIIGTRRRRADLACPRQSADRLLDRSDRRRVRLRGGARDAANRGDQAFARLGGWFCSARASRPSRRSGSTTRSAARSATGCPAACLVASAALGPAWSGGSALSRAALLLGDASYALYLVHPYPMRGLREVWSRIGPGGPAGIVSYIVAAIALSGLLAVWLHRRVEIPLVRAARKVLAARSFG